MKTSDQLLDISHEGTLIGYTQKGNPIYLDYYHGGHSDFSKSERNDALNLHNKILDKIYAKLQEAKINNNSIPKKITEFIDYHKTQQELWSGGVFNKSEVSLEQGLETATIETGLHAQDMNVAIQHPLYAEILEIMKTHMLGDAPCCINLTPTLILELVKAEEGLYSGMVKGVHSVEGGFEHLFNFKSIPLASLFSTLLAKEYITLPTKEESVVETLLESTAIEDPITTKLKTLLDLLSNSYKDLHIHL